MMSRILIVDDELMLIELLSSILEDDYDCETASTAEEALVLIQSRGYDAIICDLNLPGIGGDELIEQLRRNGVSTPVIVISGGGDRFNVDHLKRMGAFDCLLKPFRLEAVHAVVERAVQYNRRRSSSA